ncbi:NADH-quinone oxidoreductase subunit NuoE [Mumia sp. zg.B53]|uniref:NADH-quinone oxidoreductase subunit NuoE n=2 Tax=Mumia TaxID=1546255 RepID=UPI001C6EDA65|nr:MULTISPECIES: NADH-quinone oxidoreductase subunit NuoE [unclassified Mumia]MBW9209393.1 NADH-quinone oxidoreductase subunit NuoE [Mumia sp. zg.B21]MBW9214002.1 NADH-quinone oxidoreductase subunit NuoE [Mumia sp. zg.B53]MDD9349828.1 NADH-quinone oxidoreductase subunit NuoE [Mumia sp.]
MDSARVRDDLQAIMARYPQKRSALLPMLHLVQSVEGRVTAEGIELCAELLDVSTAEVNGVATFYTMYKRRDVGEHHVGVCTNTLCAVMGGDAIFARLREHLGVGNDERTADGKVTLEHIECNAACDYAPVMTVNWEFFDNQTPDSAVELVDDLRAGRTRTATRGAQITSWREAERVLAGFPDGRAHEGPAAGEPSLAGLRLANEHGWTAPDGARPSGDQLSGERPSETGTTGDDAGAAVKQADTQRAESETKVDDSTTPPAQRDEAEETE